MTQNFAKYLIKWYTLYGRSLPWRNTNDPYKIWLSEVILQQTRVDQGLKYYNTFVHRFPTVNDLASAESSEIMKLWQGLGYYSRARNLHEGAKQIILLHKGIFPSDIQQIRSIKGIGEYTAGAIASFAFNKVYPAIDGNVIRVMSRLECIDTPKNSSSGKNRIYSIVMDRIDKKQPGDFNQALMELGALICKPGIPNCPECPVKSFCRSFIENTVHKYPVKSIKTKPKDRFFVYLIPVFATPKGNFTLIHKRIEKDIWFNLYDFPLIETDSIESLSEEILPEIIGRSILSKDFVVNKISGITKHQLSHQSIFCRFVHLNYSTLPHSSAIKDYQLIPLNSIHEFAIPRLIDRYLNSNDFIFY